jgi:hypothetical protein
MNVNRNIKDRLNEVWNKEALKSAYEQRLIWYRRYNHTIKAVLACELFLIIIILVFILFKL